MCSFSLKKKKKNPFNTLDKTFFYKNKVIKK